jgi:glycosyltransferase involved in cell wall biosynthesis/ubiquinone/menaquinone biosynthesis C-methylase UbiE
VLILAQYFPPDLGGSATRAYNMAKGLSLNDCNVTVVTAFPHYPHGQVPDEYRWKPFKIERIGKIKVIRTFILPLESKGLTKRLLLFATFIFSSLFALPLVRKIDVVWAANPDIVALVPALVYGKIKRKPVTANVDDLAVEDLFDLKLIRRGSILARLVEFVTKFLYSRMELLTPISPGYVDALAERYGVAKNRIHVVYGGVDLSIFKPKASQSSSSPKKEFTVLYSGAFSIAYDFDQVLEAAKILEEKNSGVTFVLQGKGELASYIKSRVKELNLNNVMVIDKLLSREEVGELLNEADVLIQPLGDYGKPHMGVSTKLYEYQAVGKPIICCSAGTPGKYILESKSGIVVKPGDCKALAKSILYLYKNRGIAKKLGLSGRYFVEKNLSIRKIGLKMIILLNQIFDTNMPQMSKEGESIIYDAAEVSSITGETEVYDNKVFPNVIRRREVDLIKSQLKNKNPKRILDYGCGGGWLSLRLFKWGFNVVGVDISRKMVKNAKFVCPGGEFIVADAENLPFRDNVFDYVFGVSILHHLNNLKQACNELKQVMCNKSNFMFLEPNSLNPLSAIGRRFFPMEVHTKGEAQFTPTYLKNILELYGFRVKKCFMLFFFSFPIARLLKIARKKVNNLLVRLIYLFELVIEKIPLLSCLNSTIVLVGTSNK